ncbi:MAG: hypothetical protein IPH44_20245 [Myxococcales bacterium]|nr:hypothetical protein [Myxococcales bacterium]MBK7195147.1 hypothetical protein [Myxococcales bacterium]MBP6848052.1 hypothetical protein [Kofleriaceae bacterium]
MRTLAWTTLALTTVGLVACGGEDDPPPPPPRRAAAAAAAPGANARAGAGPAAGTLTTYAKIEGRADLKPGEAQTLRHAFAPTDFEGDPTGTANRDPFRSYVVAQISTNTEARHDDDVARSEKCANKKVAAGDTSIQQLKLIGVISRGTMRMATFTDAADVGWVVRLGDCIGSEHARVKLIGEGFVTLENAVIPTAADPNPQATGKDYRLRDKELIDEMSTNGSGDDDDAPRIRRRPRSLDPAPPAEAPSAGGGSGAQ